MTSLFYNNIDLSRISLTSISLVDSKEFNSINSTLHPLHRLAFDAQNNRLCRNTLLDTFQHAYNVESNHKSTAADKSVRAQLIHLPGMPQLHVGSSHEFTKDINNGETLPNRRIRVASALIVHTISYSIATDEQASQKFKNLIGINFRVPKLFIENFKRIRRSRCGEFIITPAYNKSVNQEILEIVPELKDTLLDASYIVSDAGISNSITFLEQIFLAQIGSVANEYYKLEAISPTFALTYDSGMTTTFNAISVCGTHYNSLETLQFNSFQNESPSQVDFMDACIVNQTLMNNNEEYVKCTFSPRIKAVSINNITLAHYIVLRALSIYENSLFLNDFQSFDPDGNTQPEDTKLKKDQSKSLNSIVKSLENKVKKLTKKRRERKLNFISVNFVASSTI